MALTRAFSTRWILFTSSVVTFATLCAAISPYAPDLSEDFYAKSCPQAAEIGCDVSVLLNSTATNSAEREAHVNFGLRGIKEVAVGQWWPVALGRKDASESVDLLADANLPFPVFPFPLLVQNFARKYFSAREMVVLSGAHTIGQTHCNGVLPHLYNFTGGNNATDIDPAMNKGFATFLKKLCPQGNRTNTLFLDPIAGKFDNTYYKNVLAGKGIFITDSTLITNSLGKKLVTSFAKAKSTSSSSEFADGMVKMGNLGVLTGSQGEIRKQCQFVN
ncbi:hypothetical protein R1flu_017981 [Riccia fluitans]|uniref:Plant heme peroxidase family profile domain-containing protein n=1 Tax=Riccia fluitans TaxID=41844 RepID=A0ABD1ZEI5_9MARC